MENNSKSAMVKKYFPIAGIVLLTLLLMFFFRHNKKEIGQLIEKGKKDLVAFYAQNLKPLLASESLSNEDVFNFALYQSLPIDKKEKTVLILSKEGNDNLVYEIKPSNFNPATDNYKRFAEYLNLTETEKSRADSILESYKGKIYLSVLKNDKNTLAVNSRLSEVRKAILADLIAFANEIDAQKTSQLFPSVVIPYSKGGFSRHLTTDRIPESEYIFITPDTVFKSNCTIDAKDLAKLQEKEIGKLESLEALEDIKINVDLADLENEADNYKSKQFQYSAFTDSNFFKVIVPVPEISIGHIFDDSIRIELEKAVEQLKTLTASRGRKVLHANRIAGVRPPKNISPPPSFDFNYAISAAEQAIEMVAKNQVIDLKKFGVNMDSIAQIVRDSMKAAMKKQNKFYIDSKRKKRDSLRAKTNVKDSVNLK